MGTYAGKIIAVSELNVQILVPEGKIRFHDILYTQLRGKEIYFEAVEEDGNIVSAIPFQNVTGLKKGLDVYKKEENLSMQYNDEILGKVFDAYGNLLDDSTIEKKETRGVYERNVSLE